MDPMEIREKLRKDKNCQDYVIFCLASYIMGLKPIGKVGLPKKRHYKKAKKLLEDYLNNAWLIENKVEKYVREN